MGFLDGVKNAAAKTKLQGELVLLEREITAEKKRLGSTLFQVLFEWDVTHGNDLNELPVEGLSAIYLAAKDDVMEYFPKRQAKEEALENLEEMMQATTAATPTATATEKAKNAGSWVTQASGMAKLKTEMAYYEREMNVRKDIFGIQVFKELDLETKALDLAVDSEDSTALENDEADGVSDILTPPSATNDDVLAVMEKIKRAIRPKLLLKKKKEDEIVSLQI